MGTSPGLFERLRGRSVGLVGGDASGHLDSLRCELRFDQERAQRAPDLSGQCVAGELYTDIQLLDPAGVEALVAVQWQQQLRDAVGKGT
jgi:hypothetical protein